jgi:hypothetical protein
MSNNDDRDHNHKMITIAKTSLSAMPLPFVFFRSAWYLLNLITGTVCPWGYVCNKGVRSPGLCDLMDGRRTSAESHLSNIITVRIFIHSVRQHRRDLTSYKKAIIMSLKNLQF